MFAVLNGMLYLGISVLVGRGGLDEGFFARHELVLGAVTFLFSVLAGIVVGIVARSRRVLHGVIYGAALTGYMAYLVVFSDDRIVWHDVLLAWAQVVPGAVAGTVLMQRVQRHDMKS